MLGKDYFRVESCADLSNERYKSLILFYAPLIGNDALYLYEYLSLKGSCSNYNELNSLLNSLGISIDSLEKSLEKLNQYKLVKTLLSKNDNKYIFVLSNPLTIKEFNDNDLFVRDFILKKSGPYYQSITADLRSTEFNDFKDVSAKFKSDSLKNWSKDDETFLKTTKKSKFKFDSMFDIEAFLKDMPSILFPIKYRTQENLNEIARLADIYNVSYEKMRVYVTRSYSEMTKKFDISILKSLCSNSICDYKYVEGDKYDVPCVLFLMNKQDGKDPTPFDRNLLDKLSEQYGLKPGVINVIIEHSLKNCNNKLLDNYICSIASDFHRNDISSVKDALASLNDYKKKGKRVEVEEKYDNSTNPKFSSSKHDELMKRRGKNGQA